MQLIRGLPVLAALVAALLLQPVDAAPADAPRLIAHYTHQRWSEESDAPRPVVALAQDRRGYLWIAANAGLFRFDGIRFEPMSAGIDLAVHGPPSAILVRRNGDVWTSFERSGRFAVYREGRLRFLDAPPSPDRVLSMQEAADGTIWVMTERMGLPLLRFRNGRWASFGSEAGAPVDNPFSLVVTRDGTAWISFSGEVMRLGPDASRFESVRKDFRALGRLSLDPEERVWISDRHGSYPLTGPGGRGKPPALRHPYATDNAEIRGWPRFDREGNLWIATYYDGLQRVRRPDPRGAATPAEAQARVERFTAHDGLSSNAATQIFQDAEGNVWAGTENGLDRFWPATLRYEPQLAQPAAFGDLLLRGSDGSVYIGQAATVYRVRPGGLPEPILRTPDNEPRTLCEAPDRSIWIGLSKSVGPAPAPSKPVMIWKDGSLRPGPRVPLNYVVYDCAFDAHGDFWVTGWLGGMARLHDGRWQRVTVPAGQPFAPRSMTADSQGRILVHWSDGVLGRLDGLARRSFRIPFGSHGTGDIALFPQPGAVFVASEFGVARLRDDRFQGISARRVPMFGGVNGMTRGTAGETWLASPGGILRIRTADLDRAFAQPGWTPPMQVFGAADGLRSRPHSHSRNAIVQGGDGRLWIATQTGTLWLDPKDVKRSLAPPRVAVGALVADQVYRDPTNVTLPAGRSNVQIDFAVLNFSNQHATQVRYRIEGQDSEWVDPGTRRQAFYTNLAPGTYRFRLIAATDNGAWNEAGATVEFTIPPTFVQSKWFLALCAAIVLALLWLAYRLRMAQVAGRIRARLEERMGERERIARELHDTLLQSVQGLVLRFQSVANKMPPEGPARGQLEAALARADEIIADGRDRVQGLRGAGDKGDLPELLKERAVAAGFDPAIGVRIVVEGRQRPVDPLVAVELGRIVDEALFNVHRHANAGAVEIVIRFSKRQLGVEIRDDGVGIPAEIVARGHKPGHFGLIGMRERAERIGCSFSIDSRPGMGCAVTMTLPARLAFADHAPGRRRFFSRLFRKRNHDHAA
ncbi:sensor histidine kinase [Sphingomonas kyeonggiensis]|uniref:Signal transduction histidine kinase/ligand-binding sensor domain-containing protein n=1 Tax=Sphingomonas kyeonggiensis TaxID=1268553 RepID=A0A7W6NW16_9SPHN|nr:sensor histidine kinase [Sphingomonas kyeonggiensis]MBB4098659.1 signal transduction histidine kinase/ligand-binding sensor domain-containing protein [Sphingomonas kyeonggiensis]